MAADSPYPLEQAVLVSFPWLIVGLIAALPLLLIPSAADRRWELMGHLIALVAFLSALTWRLAPLTDQVWFADRKWSASSRHLATAVTLMVIITGTTGLVTLASSAALGYQPSLQFLQLLSALDIAWVVGGTILAVRSLWGSPAAVAIGTVMGAVCVFSIGLYIAKVGLTAEGGWLVDQRQLLWLVIPFDVVAALMTIALTLLAAFRASPDRAGQTPVV